MQLSLPLNSVAPKENNHENQIPGCDRGHAGPLHTLRTLVFAAPLRQQVSSDYWLDTATAGTNSGQGTGQRINHRLCHLADFGLHPGALRSVHKSHQRAGRNSNRFLVVAGVYRHHEHRHRPVRAETARLVSDKCWLPARRLRACRCDTRRLAPAGSEDSIRSSSGVGRPSRTGEKGNRGRGKGEIPFPRFPTSPFTPLLFSD